MFGVLKNKATGETAYGQYKTVTLEGRAKTSYTYSMLVPANVPTGEADFNVIRTSTGGPDDPWDGGYLVSPVTVTVGTGSGDPDPVTGSVTVDISETHPVLTIGKASTLTFTVKNTTNTAFSKQLMPRIGSSSNTSLITSSVEKIQVNVAANSTGTFSATFTPSSSVAAGEYNLRVFDTDNKEYQARTIPVTVKAAQVDPQPTGDVYVTTARTSYQFVKGKNAVVKATFHNTGSTATTISINPYLFDTTFRYFPDGGKFDITIPANGTAEKTLNFTVATWWDSGEYDFRFYDAKYEQLQKGSYTVKVVDSGEVIDDSNGGVNPDPDPDPVTGEVTMDIAEQHPVLTLGQQSTFTITVKNGTNQAFSKVMIPRVGNNDNKFYFMTTVEHIQVDVPANSTGTFQATFKPYKGQTPGEYQMYIMDLDFKQYQSRTIPVTVKAAEVPDYTVGNIVCDKTTFNDAFIPGQSTGFTVTLRNTASTNVTEQIRTYLSTQVEGLDKFAFGEYFDVTLAAGETVERTYSVAVPSDMPEGSCTFALLNTSVKAIGGYHTVTIGKTSSETGDCPVEITNINIADKLEVGKTHSYSLTLHNTSASEHKYSIFPTISNEEQDKDVYEANFIVNITLAGGETKVYTSTFAIPGDFPIGNAKLSALRMCDGCPVNFAIYNYPVYIDNNSGVEDLEGENAEEVEWYTLQGVRIYGEPQHGHYYIRRQGSKVQKIKY